MLHSAMGHNLQPLGKPNCEVSIGGISMTHSFIVCKHLTEDLVIGLDMHQIYRIGCNWNT